MVDINIEACLEHLDLAEEMKDMWFYNLIPLLLVFVSTNIGYLAW